MTPLARTGPPRLFNVIVGLSAILVTLLAIPSGLQGQRAELGNGASAPSVRVPGPEPALPAAWVTGNLGTLSMVGRPCVTLPDSEVRRRIVDLVVREWAFFGFPVLDRVDGRRLQPQTTALSGPGPTFEYTTGRMGGVDPREAERVAAAIAGYWAVTPEGAGIVRAQNARWSAQGPGARWNAPWSAAFVSWIMCEGGLGSRDRFHRAIAHWTYIDQAIRARDGQAPGAAYVAYDMGERTVAPGDLLCSGRRPAYGSLAQRRRQMGQGASTHCDVVVAVDVPGGRILAIGGNVLRSVSLKVLAGEADGSGGLRPRSIPGAPLFAHLQLQAEPMGASGLALSAILADGACSDAGALSARGRAVLALLEVEGPWNGTMPGVDGVPRGFDARTGGCE